MKVKPYKPKRILIETLDGAIEANYSIKPIDKWSQTPLRPKEGDAISAPLCAVSGSPPPVREQRQSRTAM